MAKTVLFYLCATLLWPSLIRGAAPTALNGEDVRTIKRICIDLVGIRASKRMAIIRRLRPFAIERKEVETPRAVCSAACWHFVRLRGDVEVRCSWDNVVNEQDWARQNHQPYTIKDPRIDYVDLLFGSKKVFAVFSDWEDQRVVRVAMRREELRAGVSAGLKPLVADRAAVFKTPAAAIQSILKTLRDNDSN